MTDTIFFRLLDDEAKPMDLAGAVEQIRNDGGAPNTYSLSQTSFRQVPGSTFAYWITPALMSAFKKYEPLEGNAATVKVGLQTGDDFRYVRAYWEVSPKDIVPSGRSPSGWVPHAKGGETLPFYADIHLLVNWHRNGEDIKQHSSSRPQNSDYYFCSGLTFPYRTFRLSPSVLPEGCITGVTGMGIFPMGLSPRGLLTILNSEVVNQLISVWLGRIDLESLYQAGVIQPAPLPDLSQEDQQRFAAIGDEQVQIGIELDASNEGGRRFACFHRNQQETLIAIAEKASGVRRVFVRRQLDLFLTSEKRLSEVYELSEAEKINLLEKAKTTFFHTLASPEIRPQTVADELLSYCVGCVFGRWDTRIALDPALAPKLVDPFAPLPVCSPGMLVGPDGLPAKKDGIASDDWMRARPDAITPPPEGSVENTIIPDFEYPLAVDWDGIVVDDAEHEDDILRRVREVLELLWGERADAIEQEACELLGVKDLRTYFRNPKQFFDHHIKRYSKSRRKAPIYWLLQSPKRNHGLWLYYQRLDPDILFKSLHKYVEPKVRLEESRLEEHETRRRSAGTGGREARQAEKAVEKQEELLADLREFRDRLERAAKLHLRPDLNDGVVLNIAPLHELVPWKEAKSKWNDLLSGKYEWSSIGKQLRDKGMI